MLGSPLSHSPTPRTQTSTGERLPAPIATLQHLRHSQCPGPGAAGAHGGGSTLVPPWCPGRLRGQLQACPAGFFLDPTGPPAGTGLSRARRADANNNKRGPKPPSTARRCWACSLGAAAPWRRTAPLAHTRTTPRPLNMLRLPTAKAPPLQRRAAAADAGASAAAAAGGGASLRRATADRPRLTGAAAQKVLTATRN